MKNPIHLYALTGAVLVLFSCNNGPADPVKNAKEENTAMIDSQATQEQPADSMAMIVSKQDADFLVNAASGGMFEVELGRLTQTNAHHERVKNFGDMMVKDHGESGDLLKALATSRNVTLPDSVANRQQREKEKLAKRKGSAFDAAYIDMMVDDHKKDIREFEKEASGGTNAAIKAFANDHLKMLRTHLDSAVSIQRLVRKSRPIVPVVPGTGAY